MNRNSTENLVLPERNSIAQVNDLSSFHQSLISHLMVTLQKENKDIKPCLMGCKCWVVS